MSALQNVTFTTFVESSLTTLLYTPTRAAFDSAFDAFLAPNVLVTFNGAPLAREAYRERFWENKQGSPNNSVGADFKGAVEVAQQSVPVTGDVGVFFDALVTETLVVDVSMQLTVQRTESPANVTPAVFVDQVIVLNEISAPASSGTS